MISTDLGLLSKENANYLYSKGIITRDGGIAYALIDGERNKKVIKYSYFRWVIDRIKDTIPDKPKQVSLDVNDYVTLMRVGKIDKEYTYKSDGKKYSGKYSATYPIVTSVILEGKKYFNEVSSKKDRGKRSIDDVEF